jgi:hypothetical protein
MWGIDDAHGWIAIHPGIESWYNAEPCIEESIMKNLALLLMMSAVAVGGLSCGGTTPTPDQRGSGALTANAGKSAGTLRIDGDAPPLDARFTIYCAVVRGPNHVVEATQLKEQLNRSSGLHAWHIIHADDQSTLYYGYYRTFSDEKADPAEFARAQSEMRAVQAIKNAQGDALFQRVLFQPINEPDPDAPVAWNLANVPATAYWSLQVAAYYNYPERKQDAVAQVKDMRAKGIEAYYYHGETISSICVGAYPRSAIKEQDRSHVETPSPEDRPLVVAGTLPQNVDGTMKDKEGHRLVVESLRLEVKSPALAQAIRDFPQHIINGEAHAIRDKDGNPVYDPSFIVLVPHADERLASQQQDEDARNAAAARGADQATRAFINEVGANNDSTTRSRYGHLNSVDQK